jgi:hypothetical protein
MCVHYAAFGIVRPNEVAPAGSVLALRRGSDSMPLENIADRLVRHGVTQIRKRSNDAIVAPCRVLSRHADDQIFDGWVDLRSPEGRSQSRTIKLARHQHAKPAQNSVGPSDHDFGQSLAS